MTHSILWLLWLAVLVLVVVDMIIRYRRHELSGRMFAVWVVVVIVLPFAGIAAYVILGSSRLPGATARAREAPSVGIPALRASARHARARRFRDAR